MPQAVVPIVIAVAATAASVIATQASMPDAPDAPDPTLPPPPPPEVLEEGEELAAEDRTEDIVKEESDRRRKVQRFQATAFDKPKAVTSVNKPKSLLGE
jgi:hypothetical protein